MVTKALKGKSLFMELYDVKRDLFSVKFFLSSFLLSRRKKNEEAFWERTKTKKGGKGERERERETQTRANARVAKSSCVLA